MARKQKTHPITKDLAAPPAPTSNGFSSGDKDLGLAAHECEHFTNTSCGDSPRGSLQPAHAAGAAQTVQSPGDARGNIVVLGFPKCGTSALIRALANQPDFELIKSRSGANEVVWPEIVEIEKGLVQTQGIQVHKFAAYVYSQRALKYLVETPRTFVLCVRDPSRSLVSWHKMHSDIARAEKPSGHFAYKEREFYADCSIDDYYYRFARQRLRYDFYLETILAIVPVPQLVVVSQECMARGMQPVSAYLNELARGRGLRPVVEVPEVVVKPHVSYGDRNDAVISGVIRQELFGVKQLMIAMIETQVRHRCL